MARASTKSRSDSKSDSKTGGGTRPGESKQDETDRYKQAAEDALQQLDWAIGYLHGIRKVEISKALAKNRSYIRRQLLDEGDEPLPDQQTDET
jgi:hypothetical protein